MHLGCSSQNIVYFNFIPVVIAHQNMRILWRTFFKRKLWTTGIVLDCRIRVIYVFGLRPVLGPSDRLVRYLASVPQSPCYSLGRLLLALPFERLWNINNTFVYTWMDYHVAKKQTALTFPHYRIEEIKLTS